MVNLRGLRLMMSSGNNFGLVFLNLPLDRQQPLDRLEGVKHGMDSLKQSAEYATTYFILNILGHAAGLDRASGYQVFGYKRNGRIYKRPRVAPQAHHGGRPHPIHHQPGYRNLGGSALD